MITLKIKMWIGQDVILENWQEAEKRKSLIEGNTYNMGILQFLYYGCGVMKCDPEGKIKKRWDEQTVLDRNKSIG